MHMNMLADNNIDGLCYAQTNEIYGQGGSQPSRGVPLPPRNKKERKTYRCMYMICTTYNVMYAAQFTSVKIIIHLTHTVYVTV